MGFVFGAKSERILTDTVHPDLVAVMRHAIARSPVDFAVIEGKRTVARQRDLFNSGASKTMASRHIPSVNKSGLAEAVDIVPYLGNKIRFDWPLYHKIAPIIKASAAALGIPITWGGDWRGFPDGPHFELSRKRYPAA